MMLSKETSIPDIKGINWRIWRLYAQFFNKTICICYHLFLLFKKYFDILELYKIIADPNKTGMFDCSTELLNCAVNYFCSVKFSKMIRTFYKGTPFLPYFTISYPLFYIYHIM